MMQAIFAGAQLFPQFRSRPLVQYGVGYWYLPVCLFQVSWALAFGNERIGLSLVLMCLLWASLVGLLRSQRVTSVTFSRGADETRSNRILEYGIFQLPFAIHCGWLTFALTLNVNALFVARSSPADVQLAVGIVTTALLHSFSVWILFGIPNPNFAVSTVLCWAFGWIHAELRHPLPSIMERFDSEIISGMKYVGRIFVLLILVQMLVRALAMLPYGELIDMKQLPFFYGVRRINHSPTPEGDDDRSQGPARKLSLTSVQAGCMEHGEVS